MFTSRPVCSINISLPYGRPLVFGLGSSGKFCMAKLIALFGPIKSLRSLARALAFSLQGTANPDGPGTTGPGGCSWPTPDVARPPSYIPHSILRTRFARSIADLASQKTHGHSDHGLNQIANHVISVGEGYRITRKHNNRRCIRYYTNYEPLGLTLAVCYQRQTPRYCSSSEASTDQSDGTVRGSDSEEDDCFTTVVNKKRSRRLRKRRSAFNNSPSMDIDIQSAALTTFIDSPTSPDSPETPVARGPVNAVKQMIHTIQPAKISGGKPTAPHRLNPHHPFTYAIRPPHKVKLSLPYVRARRRVQNQGGFEKHPARDPDGLHQVRSRKPELPCLRGTQDAPPRRHRNRPCPDSTVLHKSNTAKDIFKFPPRVCGLSGITVEAPYKKSSPGQCFHCQLYGHAAQNCYALPRCVICREPHAKKECKRTKDSGDIPECVNCNSEGHPASYKGCPKAPTSLKIQPVTKKLLANPPPQSFSNKNFPALFGKTPRAARGYPRAPKPASAKQTETSAGLLGEDILTIMSMLRVVESPEFAQLAANFRKARSGEDRLIETFLKPNRPRACKLANYIQVRNDRLSAPRGGTTVYYKRKLYCCPLDTPPLINLETSACRLPMTGHGILIIVSVYLSPKKPLLRSDIESLLALGDAVILFGDLNSKNTDWRCNTTNASR
ncbi:Nucleic-acid-binding protein from transposon X-element [Eumeta japonica]|uniref:Nucleic-acid-binding protein from transposon X-element n=1 Tax=Eumeta variegata TaxID=151549 RepID=A0A4C1V161_EUMVA|nr:Nucleic-acid-binding protein from transposon X-element [Eumeta japonica]